MNNLTIIENYAGLTLSQLIESYQTDNDASFRRLRYHVRENHRGIHARIDAAHGATPLAEIDTRHFMQWHRHWSEGDKIASGHAYMAQLRTLINHGFLLLTGPDRIECFRLSQILSKLRFPQPEPRTAYLTASQADQIRMAAHERGWHSIAMAQAFQFEAMFRQKDVIGEWIPRDEPGDSDFYHQGDKWLRGLQWQEVDANLTLRHITSKRLKKLEVDLTAMPMVMDEIDRMGGRHAAGPIILNEATMVPYAASEFRRKWRILANACGIPDHVRSMDSRAGAITEASEAGAELEHIKHAATHSDIAMTQRYSRGATTKIAGVQRKRTAFRNRDGASREAGKSEFMFLSALEGHEGDECVHWPFGANHENGRATFFHNGKNHWAHRLMCEMAHGPAPVEKPLAAHECGNGHLGCVNPRHLTWKSNSENQLDRNRHGTAPDGRTNNITPEQVDEIRAKYGFFTQAELAEMYGISIGGIQYYLKYREQRGHEPSAPGVQPTNT
jgi:hypothetical protein